MHPPVMSTCSSVHHRAGEKKARASMRPCMLGQLLGERGGSGGGDGGEGGEQPLTGVPATQVVPCQWHNRMLTGCMS